MRHLVAGLLVTCSVWGWFSSLIGRRPGKNLIGSTYLRLGTMPRDWAHNGFNKTVENIVMDVFKKKAAFDPEARTKSTKSNNKIPKI